MVFTLLHGDIAQMPSLFILSVLMGLAAYCTGSLALGMALHFAYNTMSFLFLYAAQKMDGVSAFAFAGYLVAVFCVGAVVCLAAIRRLGVCAAVPAGDGVHGAARGMAAVREIRKVGFIWMISR